ncbi:tyrosine-type recombinase/integrase [Methanocaldococcus fervens]|uniref:Integrase family protein n=1 Tax=Methanocaldococcus fervens (strain DSM 4213 / JCM 15782 / AG86) TaxID=573064 RepID=C7P9M5_METFA|nr:tyrosine-type recombinase/integrase [Methanocaldococcus fervens]ACV25257.1 integrase family protein [Methanocaldococcus fervens AG86]
MNLWDWNLLTINETKKTPKGSWDMGIDYEQTYKMFREELQKIKSKKILYKDDYKKIAYLITYLLQLRNGCRIWEAISGMINIAINLDNFDWNERIIVRVRTQKRKDLEFREIILPKFITKEDIELVKSIFINIKKEIDEKSTLEEKLAVKKKIVKRFGAWLYKNYKINTHSLRYAYITYLGKRGIPAQVLAKITKHKNQNYITYYTQNVLAKEILTNYGDLDD